MNLLCHCKRSRDRDVIALLAPAVGAFSFGRVADILGRKRIYGYEVLVLAAGAIASALSPSIWWLIGFRSVLGIAIGGDYPVSSTIISEYAGKASRGLLVTLVFTMQAAGLIVGPLLAATLLVTPLSHSLIWRLLLAFGCVPALAVFYLRRQMAETPRYLLANGQHGYFFTEFGPNSTTFVYPAEIFPVKGRTSGHGIASAAGKLAGFTVFFYFRSYCAGMGCRQLNRPQPLSACAASW